MLCVLSSPFWPEASTKKETQTKCAQDHDLKKVHPSFGLDFSQKTEFLHVWLLLHEITRHLLLEAVPAVYSDLYIIMPYAWLVQLCVFQKMHETLALNGSIVQFVSGLTR